MKMISRADRSAISRAVAKAIACHNAGKQEQADRTMPWGPWATAGIKNALAGIER
ncbi:MAG TPA: hypothetical protein VMF05_13440 [Stellaceae bacterium]|jgi:hypothetical protein|nr:hypothetical protein [Stellaceae bacterium]